jgi:hypothetical protein
MQATRGRERATLAKSHYLDDKPRSRNRELQSSQDLVNLAKIFKSKYVLATPNSPRAQDWFYLLDGRLAFRAGGVSSL